MNTNKKILLIVALMLIGLGTATIINVAINFREYAYNNAVEKSKMTAEIVRDGLTAHMVNGIMAKREFLLSQKMLRTYGLFVLIILLPKTVQG